ncbi:hypothetical protein [Kitasatospora sp. NPDC094015]|uniref:hypothetical protein n=1 Tax=Kitasatospora sp. NPDC094015 TaxID=3155205 RepID=UPI00331CA495
MTHRQTYQSAPRPVGVRSTAEVEQAFGELERGAAAPNRQTQLSRGSLAAYLWALGRGDTAPVTGARGTGRPDLLALTAEVDAAMVELEYQSQRTVPRDYTQGVHDALSWVCGHTDDHP